MPNPVIHFEVRGRDVEALQAFYRDAFGWDIEVIPNGYGLVETESHTHDGEVTTFTGDDAFMNDVTIDEQSSPPTWRFSTDEYARNFTPGIYGGIGEGEPAVIFGIQAKDLDALLARITELGGRTVREPVEVAPNVVTALFADPEGNVLMLTKAP